MGAVADILSEVVDVEVNGRTYRVLPLTTARACRVLGPKVMGLVRAEDDAKRRSALFDKQWQAKVDKQREFTRDLLSVCLYSPRLGDETSDERDTITFDDLDFIGDAEEVAVKILDLARGDVDFPESSGEPEAQPSPEALTESGSDTA